MLDLFSPAGAAMYEHALRLGQEVSGLDSLQKQVCFFDIFAVKLINDLGSSLINLQGNEKLSAHLKFLHVPLRWETSVSNLFSGKMLSSSYELTPSRRTEKCLDCKTSGQNRHRCKLHIFASKQYHTYIKLQLCSFHLTACIRVS